MSDSEKYITTMVGEELAVKSKELSGDIVSAASEKYVTTVVETDKGNELALKVKILEGGGGGGGYVLPTATADRLGGVKIGSGVNVAADGTISVPGGGDASKRNVGEMVFSTIPLSDVNLHELDGSLLTHSTTGDIVDVLGAIYAQSPTSNIFVQPIPEKEYFYETVGNPTDNEGVITISNNSPKQYAESSLKFKPSANNVWEVVGKFNISSNTNQPIIMCGGYVGSENNYTFLILLKNTGALTCLLSFNGTSWEGGDSIKLLTLNTDFSLKFASDGSKYEISVSYDDGETWDLYYTYTSSAPIPQLDSKIVFGSNGYSTGYSQDINGTVDMNGCYIKDNGITVWQGVVGPLTAEQNFHRQVAANGYCDGYVYDSVNNTLRIPDLRKKASFPLGNASKYVVVK